MRSPSTTKTALLVIDIQQGLHHPTGFGHSRSTPDFEQNVQTLLASTRAYNNKKSTTLETKENQNGGKIEIIHVHHLSLEPNSPLRPDHVIDWTSMSGDDSLRGKKGVDAMDCAAPIVYNSNASQTQSNGEKNNNKIGDGDQNGSENQAEKRFTKTTNSAFIGTDLEKYLRGLKVRQLLMCGLTMEHCISTTVRMASNLAVTVPASGEDNVGTSNKEDEKVLDEKRRAGDPEGIVLVRDCCAAFGKIVPASSASSSSSLGAGKGGGERIIDAETVMDVNVESLREAFCEVVDVRDVVDLLGA